MLTNFSICLYFHDETVDQQDLSPNHNRIKKTQGRSMSIQSSDNGSNITLLSSGSSGEH